MQQTNSTLARLLCIHHLYEEVEDETTTIEMKQCTAYVTHEEVAMGVNLAYQGVNLACEEVDMKKCTAYIAHKKVVTEVNPAYEETYNI